MRFATCNSDARGEDAAEVCITLGTRLEDFDEPEFVRQASRRIAAYAAYQDSATTTASPNRSRRSSKRA